MCKLSAAIYPRNPTASPGEPPQTSWHRQSPVLSQRSQLHPSFQAHPDGITGWTHLCPDTELSIKDIPRAPSHAGQGWQGKAILGKIPNSRPGAKKCNKNHGNTQKCTAPGREAGSAAGQGKVLSNKPRVGGRGTPPGASVLENPRMPRIWADKTQEGWGVPSTVRAGDGARSFQVQPRTCRQQREQSLPIPRFPALPGAAGSIPSQHIHGKHKEQEPP